MEENRKLSVAHIKSVRSMSWRMACYFAGFVVAAIIGLVTGLCGSGAGWLILSFCVGVSVSAVLFTFGTVLICMAAHPGAFVRVMDVFVGRRALEESVWMVIHKDVSRLLGRCPDAIERRLVIQRAISGMLDESLRFTPQEEYLAGLVTSTGIVAPGSLDEPEDPEASAP